MYSLKQEKSEIDKTSKEIKSRIDDLEAQLLQRLNDEETDTSSGRTATARRTELTLPIIEDWEEFEAYIKENDAIYMLGRRPSAAAFREILQQGEEVPGLRPFTKTSISLTKKR
jgi:hypothetical protein